MPYWYALLVRVLTCEVCTYLVPGTWYQVLNKGFTLYGGTPAPPTWLQEALGSFRRDATWCRHIRMIARSTQLIRLFFGDYLVDFGCSVQCRDVGLLLLFCTAVNRDRRVRQRNSGLHTDILV